MKEKPKTPYQRLVEDVRRWTLKIRSPWRKAMWVYPKNRLSEGWRLTDLDERVRAADQLGYDVVLVGTEAGLEVQYRKRPGDPPMAVRW